MSIFSPAPHIERLPADQIDERYKSLRRQVFLGTFIGYATFYLIRKNFSLAMPYMIQDYGYSKADLGIVLTMLSVAYGVSKFVMGNISDRSNPKYFATLGLLLSALVTLAFGVVPGVMTSIPIMRASSDRVRRRRPAYARTFSATTSASVIPCKAAGESFVLIRII